MEVRSFLTMVHQDADGIFVLWRRRFMVQVRRNRLTPATLHELDTYLQRSGVLQELQGIISIVEPGAQLLNEEARNLQKALMDRFLARAEMRMVAVVLGDDVVANLMRSSGRLIQVGNPKIQKFSQIHPALSWLHQELAPDRNRPSIQDLATLVEHVRVLANASP